MTLRVSGNGDNLLDSFFFKLMTDKKVLSKAKWHFIQDVSMESEQHTLTVMVTIR